MNEQKIFFSNVPDKDTWIPSSEFVTFVLIPRQWWLPSAWKLAWHLRGAFLNTLMRQTIVKGSFIKFETLLR